MSEESHYRVPDELRVTTSTLRRILFLGSCLSAGISENVRAVLENATSDFLLINNLTDVPSNLPSEIKSYDVIIIQFPIRAILPDFAFAKLNFEDKLGHKSLFDMAVGRLELAFRSAESVRGGCPVPILVLNFILPQQDLCGRLLPRYDYRNYVYFIERLNEELSRIITDSPRAYILDIDGISASLGRRFIQDDGLWASNHGGVLTDNDFELDGDRTVPVRRTSELYPSKAFEFVKAFWSDVDACWRSINLVDSVKMIIVDLDQTLWRGTLVDDLPSRPDLLEGWPLGFGEALLIAKKRGVILALCSKNDEHRVIEGWDRIFGGRLAFSEFTISRINWKQQSANVWEIIRQASLLPKSVVFIDDSPRERDEVRLSIPGIRVLESELYSLRRVVLWSAEMQQALITHESAGRHEAIVAQGARDQSYRSLDRESFLRQAAVTVTIKWEVSIASADGDRAMELLTRTNQFNTSGSNKITIDLLAGLVRAGCKIVVAAVRDRYVDYGIMVAVVIRERCIECFAMSCRIIGLDVEKAVLSAITHHMVVHFGHATITANLSRVPENSAAHDLFSAAGFKRLSSQNTEEVWVAHAPFGAGPDTVTVDEPLAVPFRAPAGF